ncbi:hypothetical protein ACQ4PT_036415 [Festuca glaucescens]
MATEQNDKEEIATDFFVRLLGQAFPRQHDISLPAVGRSPVDLSGLEAGFTEKEVWEAIRSMPEDKSPGPDGFSWAFYRHCWPVIKMDVLDALREIFLGRCQHFGGLNNAYITLLPKRDGAVDMSDHRPISLVHSFAKLLAKILASRLAPRMDELVDRNQSAFIRGRCIQDNFILVQQSARLLFRKRVPMLMLKLDFARAFDSVSWPFLLSVLRQRGFGPRWIRWISMLLGTATTQLARDVFDASTTIAVGDGAQVLFWDDPWINGVSARCIAPAVVNMVRPSVSRKLSVHDGLVGNHWASTISGELSVDATVQFLKLWDAVHATATGSGPDSFRWKWMADGTFTTRSAYRAFFAGRTILAGAAQI